MAERPAGFIAVDRFHRAVSALCVVSGVAIAGSVVWGLRRFWLSPGHALPAAALTVTIDRFSWPEIRSFADEAGPA